MPRRASSPRPLHYQPRGAPAPALAAGDVVAAAGGVGIAAAAAAALWRGRRPVAVARGHELGRERGLGLASRQQPPAALGHGRVPAGHSMGGGGGCDDTGGGGGRGEGHTAFIYMTKWYGLEELLGLGIGIENKYLKRKTEEGGGG